MTAAQAFALIGGVCQIIALAWAWFAIYRLWLSRWSDTPRIPEARPCVGVDGQHVASVRPLGAPTPRRARNAPHDDSRRGGRRLRIRGRRGHGLRWAVEARLRALELITRRQYEKQAGQIAELRRTVNREVSAL